MLQHYGNIFKIGVLIQKTPKGHNKPQEGDRVLIQIGWKIKAVVDKRFRGSLAIREVDAGSCNGCELEVHDLNNVYYNIGAIWHSFLRFAPSCRHTIRHRISFPAHGSRAETYLFGTITRSTNLVRSSLMQ